MRFGCYYSAVYTMNYYIIYRSYLMLLIFRQLTDVFSFKGFAEVPHIFYAACFSLKVMLLKTVTGPKRVLKF